MNDVQKYLDFLYRCAKKDESVKSFENKKGLDVFYDNVSSNKNLDTKKIYDTLSNFAFLTLMHNSNIKIDEKSLNTMVNEGVFTRVVNPVTFEGGFIDDALNGRKVPKNGIVIKDEFNQEYLVKMQNKKYLVTTQCHPVADYDWLSGKKVKSFNVVNIIRNGMIHNTTSSLGEEYNHEVYRGFIENTKGENCFSFRSSNDCVVILATESWLREFKKVFFLDSHCFVGHNTQDFYFLRFLPVYDKCARNEEELELILKNSIGVKVTIKDEDKNYMEARMCVEEKLFDRVLSKDYQLRYAFKTKSGEELLAYLNNHNENIKQFMSKVLIENGYKDFEISFTPFIANKNIDELLNVWKVKVNKICEFYDIDDIKWQYRPISAVSMLLPYGGMNFNEEFKYGITPQMISLFLSTVESTRKEIDVDTKYSVLYDLYSSNKLNKIQRTRIENVMQINNKNDKLGQYITDKNVDEAFKCIENSIDKNEYESLCVTNAFELYFARHELAFTTACASIYNGLIENGFYEDWCVKDEKTQKLPTISGELYQDLKNLDMNNFLYVREDGNSFVPYSISDKIAVLSGLRNLLVHGGGRIDYSTISDDVSETEIIFKGKDSNVQIHTDVQSIMDLFSNRTFYKNYNVKDVYKNKK